MTSSERRAGAMRFIVCIGVVSLFADMTYEGAYSIIGPFWAQLHASALTLGFVAGGGEMLASSLRYFSGRFVDRTRSYWAMAISGYVVNLLAIPALAFTGNWEIAALLIFAERSGKALRGPARDVLLSEATAEVGHGWGFGIHGAMDQTGAVLGPLWMAVAVARRANYSSAFLPLAIPAAAALTAILVARAVFPTHGHPPKVVGHQPLPRVYRSYVAAAGLLAFGYIDWVLLSFHWQRAGVFGRANLGGFAIIPLLYVVAMGAEGACGLLIGKLYDRFGVVMLSIGTLGALLALPFGFLLGAAGAVAAAVCWGLGMGAQDACLRSGIAQVVSMNKRGNAFGIFSAVFGLCWWAGSTVMGYLIDHFATAPLVVVTFSVVAQVLAAAAFFRLRGDLAAAAASHAASK